MVEISEPPVKCLASSNRVVKISVSVSQLKCTRNFLGKSSLSHHKSKKIIDKTESAHSISSNSLTAETDEKR